jgi:hypothetical protein
MIRGDNLDLQKLTYNEQIHKLHMSPTEYQFQNLKDRELVKIMKEVFLSFLVQSYS